MDKKSPPSIMVNIFFKKEDQTWIGHCLELDIVATGNNLHQLKADMKDLIIAQIEYAFTNDNLDNLFHPAPVEAWKEFYQCKQLAETKFIVKTEKKKTGIQIFIPPWIIAKTCQLESAHA
jgi:hypothetical protein